MSVAFKASPYHISTITVTGSISTDVQLDTLYNTLATHTPNEISYLEFGKNKHDLQSTGINSNKSKSKKKNQCKKRFDNQLTIVLFYMDNKYNIKLFKNGNVQITGVKSIEKGKIVIGFLIDTLKNIHSLHDPTIIKNVEELKNTNYKICLINSDFKVNFEIRLDYLYKIVTTKYKIIGSYEPCIYPGAKIEYYYPNNGYCVCKDFCNGKRESCKKITIAVFQSGCVIITGANKIEHIEIAYAFITDILKDNLEQIERKKLILPPSK